MYETYTILGKEVYINKYSELWDHTKMRINNAKDKAKNDEDFKKKMVQRLMKIKHQDKLEYAIIYLKECGYDEIVDIYESKILMNELL